MSRVVVKGRSIKEIKTNKIITKSFDIEPLALLALVEGYGWSREKT